MMPDNNSPAAQAGLQRRDQLKEVDGAPIRNQRDLAAIVAAKAPGDTLQMNVARGEENWMFAVKLEMREDFNSRLSARNNPASLQLKIREGLLNGAK